MQPSSSQADRTLIGILVLIVVLVVVAVIVVFTRGTAQPLEKGTPQRAVQDYATAVIAGDRESALELLAPTWKEDCDQAEYRPTTTTDVRITLIDTRVHERTATVTVVVATGTGGGPFTGSDYQYEDAFQLERHGSDWLIASAPWEIAICPVSDLS